MFLPISNSQETLRKKQINTSLLFYRLRELNWAGNPSARSKKHLLGLETLEVVGKSPTGGNSPKLVVSLGLRTAAKSETLTTSKARG